MTVRVYPCGTQVQLSGEDVGASVNGLITGVLLRGALVMYEVAWWDGRANDCDWFQEFEFQVEDGAERVRVAPKPVGQ